MTGAPLQAASEHLWVASGRQYGDCEVLVRPCRASCAPEGSVSGWWWREESWPYVSSGQWPAWLDMACGRCSGSCSCSSVSWLVLPELVQSIVSVLVDGEELPVSGYALYDGYRLARVGAEWPLCQDWSVPVSGVGAWSVTAVFGRPVPMLGRLAVAELASQYDKACTGAPGCRLPSRLLEEITRAGVTKRFIDSAKLREADLTGLPLVDQFLNVVNPDRMRIGPKIVNPDDYAPARRPGGVTW